MLPRAKILLQDKPLPDPGRSHRLAAIFLLGFVSFAMNLVYHLDSFRSRRIALRFQHWA
jgi:hypothetical protein